jgi:hypothetical protein
MRGKELIEKKKSYKRLKRTCWTIFFVLLSILVISFILMYLTSRGPKPGEYLITRTTPNIVVFTDKSVPIDLVITPTALTGSIPPPEGRQLDILIGLDNSLSMTIRGTDKTPLAVIKDIAKRFIENTDMERHQVGIATLDDRARVIQTLSHNSEVLKNVVNEIPRGFSTRIHEGLQVMDRELDTIRRRPGSLKVAIILSDGRSSERLAREAAEKVKQQNIYMGTIGLGDTINDNLMKAIASWPSEYDKVITGEKVSVQELEKNITNIYLNWVKNLEQLVAVDVRVREYYNRSGLDLVRTSLSPSGTLDETSIEWALPFLTTRPETLQYVQKTPGIGWYQLDDAIGTISLKPVGKKEMEMPIHQKPKVIVLSLPLLLLLLLLLLLPLLPWFIRWWQLRQAALGPAMLPEEIPQPKLFPTPEFLAPLDLQKLVRSTVPTLVIGLGGTGRWVLTYLKKAILETNYGRMPKTVKFLLIDAYEREIKGEGASTVQVGGVELDEDECIILNEGDIKPENLLERTRSMSETPKSEPHLENWWQARAFKDLTPEAFQISSGTKQRRPFGRLALFLDLEGGTETSRFWTSISSLLSQLHQLGEEKNEGTNVFIASSLSGGMGSGMFIDVAYLVRHIAANEDLAGITIHAALTLQNTFAAFSDSLELVTPNTFAGLRELDRYLSCRDFHFPMIYSPDKDNKINGTLQAPLLDNCYVFDAERIPFSLRRELPEKGVFPSMSDTLHTFLYNKAGSAFDQEVRQRKAVSELEREESGHGVVSSLGTFVFRLPMFEYVQTFKCRFARESIAELFGFIKNEKGQWTQPSLHTKDTDMLDGELEHFLNKEGKECTPADVLQVLAANDIEMLLAIVEDDRAAKDMDGYIQQRKVNYSRHLSAYLMNFLNGKPGSIDVERKKSFTAALYVTRGLKKRIEEISNQQVSDGRSAKVVYGILSAYQEVTEAAIEKMKVHEKAILLPLLDHLETWERQQLENRKIDTSILVREYLYDDNLERKLYQDYLGEKVRKEHLPRFVWHCQEKDGQAALELKLAVDTLQVFDPTAQALENAKLATALPEILLQSLWDMDITPYIKTAYPEADKLTKKIYEKSMPLIQYEKDKAVRHILKMFLSIRQSDYLTQLVRNLLPNFPSREHIQGTEFRDSHVFSSVSVLDSLPLPALRPYEQSLKGYLALPVTHRQQLHVFAPEQQAVIFEDMLPEIKEPRHDLHPKFISHLVSLDRTKLFASCAVNGVIPDLFRYDVDHYYIDISDNSGHVRCLLAQKEGGRKPTPLDALGTFITGKSKSDASEPIPYDRIENLLKKNPPVKKNLKKKETEINQMKADKEISSEVKSLLSFIHLVLNDELKKLEK